jgi:hypothetical protein
MARCPAGHESQASDYCDTCGLVIGGGPASAGAASLTALAVPSGLGAGLGGAEPGAQAGGGGAGSRCPVCQADRNGRFCEECGYDFDLAEAMPEVTMTPGVLPAQPGQETSALAATVVSVAPQASAESESESEPEPEPDTGMPGSGGGGLDLDAELARAEAEAGAAAESAAFSTAGPGGEVSPDPGMSLMVGPQAVPEAPAGPSGLSAGGMDSSVWGITLVVNADRDYYRAQTERGDIAESEFPFPKYPSERRFTFADGPVRIGRASASRGLSPEIDLTGPPLDPAVSHLHAQLLRHPEGWVVVDLGSANGTRLNDADEPLEAETEIPVKAGDRIHLGVWTTITVQ